MTLHTGSEWATLVQPYFTAILAGYSEGARPRMQAPLGAAGLNLASVLPDTPVSFDVWRSAVVTCVRASSWWGSNVSRLLAGDDHLGTYMPELESAQTVAAFADVWEVFCTAAGLERVQVNLGDRRSLFRAREQLLARVAAIDAILAGQA